MSIRQVIPYSLLLIAFLVWMFFKPQEPQSITPEHLPSYIAHNVDNIHYDELGNITHKVYATKATSYSNKEMTLFEKPKVLIYITNQQDNSITTWQITSEEGVLAGENELTLSKDVWVRNLSVDQLVQTMNTEKLIVLLEQKEISSELMVYWQGPAMKQQGIGMWASLVNEELIVKNQIKAVYLNETK